MPDKTSTKWDPSKGLNLPLRWRKVRHAEVLGGLFHDRVSDDHIAKVFAMMACAPRHTFRVVTQHPTRMRSLLSSESFRPEVAYWAGQMCSNGDVMHDSVMFGEWPRRNIWLGVSVTNQDEADSRISALLETPAAVRFLSCEPLLGPVNLRHLKVRNRAIDCLGGDVTDPTDGAVLCGTPSVIDWVIVGGESGPGARPMNPKWARSLRDQTQDRAAFHFKQWGEWGPAPFIVRVCDPKVGWLGSDEELVEAKRRAEAEGATHVHTGNWYMQDGQKVWGIHEIGHKPWSLERVGLPDGMEPIRRWGKGKAGRDLDGREWNEFPTAREEVATRG